MHIPKQGGKAMRKKKREDIGVVMATAALALRMVLAVEPS
jgi:hypothetical protein